ncbi:hypothetical protein GCM10007989_13510 [Devosia pacifica]|uniref:Uncharacterized protein n=1 Tax=Devosia pacifica TaxID=1335967 RepID=A0A918VQE6_9HYPH|nr:hypothetical protein [Devosia pacifica]GHA19298.1 hypothetical protein GCM10007989_13510 [Devosia pacifica]
MNISSAMVGWICFVALAVVGGLGGLVYIQSERLAATERQLSEAREELAGAEKAITELAVENEAARLRETRARIARDGILTAPASEDSPMSQILLRGLRGADNVGGLSE